MSVCVCVLSVRVYLYKDFNCMCLQKDIKRTAHDGGLTFAVLSVEI